ncbi:MAG: flavin reductase [Clostridia bacterium]|nr:flavin reductase [Clostridia bacterium]
MKITNDILYVGVNDHEIDLFEGMYDVPNGMAYNSYLIKDDKIAVMDTVDRRFTHQWLDNLQKALGGRKPDYLVVQHMEPDHSANIRNFLDVYGSAKVVASSKAFDMMRNFFGSDFADRRVVVGEGDTLELGHHTLRFVAAPMVHWPEVLMTYDESSKTFFAADAFGKFGALDVEEDWACEARRYYFGIVGKYGQQVQLLLKKAAGLDIQRICPLHGPVLDDNLGYYLGLYNTWSSYGTETDGIAIFYTSVYGNTKAAVELLADRLKAKGAPRVEVSDLARCDMAEAVEDAFRYGKIILATTTYNAEIFPFMHDFIHRLVERNWANKTVAFVENGSWAPMATRTMMGLLEKSKNLKFATHGVHIKSALSDANKQEIEDLSDELCGEYQARAGKSVDKNDPKALFNIGYGLYVVTSNDGEKDNGLIVNTVTQVTNTPNRVAVTINKQNYSHHVIQKTGVLNVNCLSVEAPFSVFEDFGFRSGRAVNKFEGKEVLRSDNGLVFLDRYINSFMSLKVENYIDLGTHGMFICSVTEARVINKMETMTYTYYQNNVKPKPATEGKKGFVCKVCGYIYEGDTLPEDIICPLCKHGAADFEPIK